MISHRTILLPTCSTFVLILSIGCSHQPQISKPNVQLVNKLRTAVAVKKTDWLEATAKQIDQQHRSGRLSDDEYAALEPIVADARQAHWIEANEKLTRLIRAQ